MSRRHDLHALDTGTDLDSWPRVLDALPLVDEVNVLEPVGANSQCPSSGRTSN